MKKIMSLVFILLISITLASCSDRKINNNYNDVFFYTRKNDNQIKPLRNIAKGDKINEPETPTNPGHIFLGWYKEHNFKNLWDFSVDTVDTTTILYAKWESHYFSISYVLNGGEMPSTFKYLEEFPEDQRDPKTNPELLKYLFFKTGGRGNTLPKPTRLGYTFRAFYLYDQWDWTGGIEGVTTPYKPGDTGYNTVPNTEAKDITLYAHWNPVVIQTSFNANYPDSTIANNVYKSRSMQYGYYFIYDSDLKDEKNINRLPDFKNIETINGIKYDDLEYEFIGWNTRREGTGIWYGDGQNLSGNEETLQLEQLFNTIFYAQWQKK